MKVIFLTMDRVRNVEEHGIYTDLMRYFRDQGHQVYIVTPYERQFGLSTALISDSGVHILGVKTLNIQKTNFFEKGVGIILLERQFNNAIKRYLSGIDFDLILYATPPITLTKVIGNLKRRNHNALSYLLLKDIFPQNAVDLGLFSSKGLLHNYFRKKEKKLYRLSDYIGCMSPANVRYLLEHNPEIRREQVEVNPNTIELLPKTVLDRAEIRRKYGLPLNTTVFIYGGNLGKPQAIAFLLQVLEVVKEKKEYYFLVVGNGTEYSKLKEWFDRVRPMYAKLMQGVPKYEYDTLVAACDVGLIFLDPRFTIPNFPSRLLSYLEHKMPILAATDIHTDIGKIACKQGFGYWCKNGDIDTFISLLPKYQNEEHVAAMGNNGYRYLKENYLVSHSYQKILSHCNSK